MAFPAYHQRLAPSCRHNLHPERFDFTPLDVQVFECSDVVDFNVSHFSADFTLVRHEALQQFTSLGFPRKQLLIANGCFQIAFEWYSAKASHERFLAFSLHANFYAFSGPMWKFHRFDVSLPNFPGTRFMLVRQCSEKRTPHDPA